MMKKIFEITDEKIISEILSNAQYGTLALCRDNKPYSLPINFVELNGEIFFHGAKKGKKMDMIKSNSFASFSVVEDYSLLPSYFSTENENACPATHLFKSVIIDGKIELIEEYDEKVNALQGLMQKLQKEGGFKHLSDKKMYEKAINATQLFKLVPEVKVAKFKLGQNFNEERYQRVCEHLVQRRTKKDLATLELLKEFWNKDK
jgi:nitroimidazol reductase NimA-like FMN-containing flavoprotein (pyridoxamine 5'-phosphate oxidase superfamily)